MIETKQLTKTYGKQIAVSDVTIKIEENQITGLIGPNGAGKSTLMKMICGYIEPTAGNVFINSLKVNIHNYSLRRNIGYLPENNPLYYDMYIKEYLDYVAGIYKIKNKTESIKKVIELTGIQKEQHKKIGQLSKGFKQRVGLSQAIIHDPDILILDEPTTGLDPNQIIEIRNLISDLGKNKTVLLSTHILQEVEAICNNVIIVNNGKIIANEHTTEIKKNLSKNLIVEFDKNPDIKSLNSIEGVKQVKYVKGTVWIIESIENRDLREAIFNFAVKNGFVILSSQIQEMKLEEIFQQLIKNN